MENHIKSEVIEKSQLVHALPNSEENRQPLSEPRRSASVACGASVFEVCMRVPAWASQVLSYNPVITCLIEWLRFIVVEDGIYVFNEDKPLILICDFLCV